MSGYFAASTEKMTMMEAKEKIEAAGFTVKSSHRYPRGGLYVFIPNGEVVEIYNGAPPYKDNCVCGEFPNSESGEKNVIEELLGMELDWTPPEDWCPDEDDDYDWLSKVQEAERTGNWCPEDWWPDDE